MRELWQKIAFTSAAQAYSLTAGIVILTVTARWLGPEGRGTIAAITTWVGLFSTLGHLSLGQVAIHRATQLRGQAWLGSTLGSLLLVDAVVTLLGWGVAAGIYGATSGNAFHRLPVVLMAIGFVGLPLMIWEQYGSALLMAVDRVPIYNRAQLYGRTAGLVLIVLAWFVNWGVAGVLAVTIASQSIVALTGIGYLFRHAGAPVRAEWRAISELLKGGLKLHLNAIGDLFFASASILIVNHYLGASETGYYQLALQLLWVLAVVPASASMVIYGRVAELGPDAAWVQQRRLLVLLMCGMLAVAVLAALLAPVVIPLVMGPRFAPSVGLFHVLLLVVFGGTLMKVMLPQWVGRGLFGYMSVLTVSLGSLNLGATLLLVPRYGAYGAAWSLAGTYLLVAFVQSLMAIRCERSARSAGLLARQAS